MLKPFIRAFSASMLLAFPTLAVAAEGVEIEVSGSTETRWLAISIFVAFVLLSLVITYFAARKTKTSDDFYSAGSSLSGAQNGFAIAGDWMSAATFLGMSGLVFVFGVDGIVYAVGAAISWPIVMCILAGRIRNLGSYSYVDVVAYRLQNTPIRILLSCSGLSILFLYLIAQMVGAGALIQILFGLPYTYAIVLVGALMTVYVSFGGMLATSWIQIIKAWILLVGGTFLAYLALKQFGFSPGLMIAEAKNVSPRGSSIFNAGNLIKDPISAISLALAFLFGPAGLPHILMRFFTVKDDKAARNSVAHAAFLIGYFQIVVFIIGLAAISLLAKNSGFFDSKGMLLGGANMSAVHLSNLLGGEIFLGIVSAVTFATILAVVAGLTLAAASVFSHDLYSSVIAKGKGDGKTELKISRLSTIFVGIIAICLGLLFEKQNVAYMATLSLAVAATVNFVLLALSLFWKDFTTKGAIWGGACGLVTALTLVMLSKPVWVDLFGNAAPIYPYAHPTLFSMSVTLIICVVVSKFDNSEQAKIERSKFAYQENVSVFGSD